jgi:hypothetical protein
VHRAADCHEPTLEAARRRVFYARSAAGAAEQLWRDHALAHGEYARRLADERQAQRCLEQRMRAEQAQRLLIDGEQVGLD